jgi:hypothetical protein
MERIGLDVAECILRFLDLPAAAYASGTSHLWYHAHRRRGAVIGYHPTEWSADRHDQPEDLSFERMTTSLALINTPTVEWLVVSFPDTPPRRPVPFDDGALTEFVIAWLAMQSLPALRSLYVRIPASLSFLTEGHRWKKQKHVLPWGDYYRVRHTLSLVCRAGCTPRLTEFGLNVFDPSNAFRGIWLGLRGRSLSTVKATFRNCLHPFMIEIETLADVLSCAAANIIFDVPGDMYGSAQSMSRTMPVLDDAT